ncbi:unnamed protein product [Adineta steineri]|uniref:ADP ribosyltransferase domain-containing protein n=1 Tax=Adineta steineri TaxID=433720 RepID=A0A819P4U4_9BILA|nr:unnamed protein product [Adineta steineri]CAF4008638.1 unnamed protein product [Adineta steineri]
MKKVNSIVPSRSSDALGSSMVAINRTPRGTAKPSRVNTRHAAGVAAAQSLILSTRHTAGGLAESSTVRRDHASANTAKSSTVSRGRTADGAAESSTAIARSKDTEPRRRINVPGVPGFLLIFLDNKFNDTSIDYRNTIDQLRCIINDVRIYKDADQCILFLKTIDNNKVCMVIADSLGQDLVRRIHNMLQVNSIFIFSSNKKHSEQWATDYSKIDGVSTEITAICEAVNLVKKQCEQDTVAISFLSTNDDISMKNLDQLDVSFMYSEILKGVVLTIKFEQKDFEEFVEYCGEVFCDNKSELHILKDFKQNYCKERAIWWYTRECFLYRMLNKSLRLMDIDTIIKIGFFLSDLHYQIAQLHEQQFGDRNFSNRFIVYRGQGLSKTDFEQMVKTMGGLISFNNFLSTSKNREVSQTFSRHASSNPDMVGVLFVMTINPAQSTTPFASVNEMGYFREEDEILFAMNTIFRIDHIKLMDEHNRLYQVDLTVTMDNDKDLRMLSDRIQEESEGLTGWDQMGELLIKMRQAEKAEQVYENILAQTSDESERAPIYYQLGLANKHQGKHDTAITHFEKALEIDEKTLPANHPDLAMNYESIGNTYADISDHWKALSCYEKALEIRQKSLPANHRDLASSYTNIGNVYNNLGDYNSALQYYEKDLEISRKSLPPNHPDLAASYNNIGSLYDGKGDYVKALSYYERSVEIAKRSLLPNHPDLQDYKHNLNRIKDKLK